MTDPTVEAYLAMFREHEVFIRELWFLWKESDSFPSALNRFMETDRFDDERLKQFGEFMQLVWLLGLHYGLAAIELDRDTGRRVENQS